MSGWDRLKDVLNSPARELTFSDVYRLPPKEEFSMMDRSLPPPNSVGLSPDEKMLHGAECSACWFACDLTAPNAAASRPPFSQCLSGDSDPDGPSVDVRGNVWEARPRGRHIFDPSGKPIGVIEGDDKISNSAFATDDRLYLTVNHATERVRLKVKGFA